MKRVLIACSLAAIIGIGLYLRSSFQHASEADSLEDFTAWQPTTAAIRAALETNKPADPSGNQNRELYAQMFTSRFRLHDPKIAVRIKYVDREHVALMCPARMEPWNMDQLAMAIWRESRTLFNTNPNIDIFETFIGSSRIKVGEVRSQKEHPQVACIRYVRAPDKHKSNEPPVELIEETAEGSTDGTPAARK